MSSEIAPGFLIAVPQLDDPNFRRAVVLMLEHSDQGAMGIVINRPGTVKLSDVARSHSVTAPGLTGSVAFVGGPVEPERGFVLHDAEDVPEAVSLGGGLQVSGSIESLKVLFHRPVDHFRLCLGYAGWGPGQIEKELREGSWISTGASVKHVLRTPPSQVWEQALRDMGIDPAMLLASGGRGGLQ